MSRTDKTKPWRVRLNEHHAVAQHDHTEGICDLPGSPLDEAHWWAEQYCHWYQSCQFGPWRGSCCGGCGCRMCTGYWWRRAQRRADRHRSARQMRGLLKIVRTAETEVVDAADS